MRQRPRRDGRVRSESEPDRVGEGRVGQFDALRVAALHRGQPRQHAAGVRRGVVLSGVGGQPERFRGIRGRGDVATGEHLDRRHRREQGRQRGSRPGRPGARDGTGEEVDRPSVCAKEHRARGRQHHHVWLIGVLREVRGRAEFPRGACGVTLHELGQPDDRARARVGGGRERRQALPGLHDPRQIACTPSELAGLCDHQAGLVGVAVGDQFGAVDERRVRRDGRSARGLNRPAQLCDAST